MALFDEKINEKVFLIKDIKEENIGEYKDKIAALYPDTEFSSKIQDEDNKENGIIAKLPAPFEFSISISDGNIEILDADLTSDQIQNLSHMFHLLGIKSFKFSYGTGKENKNFAEEFQTHFNQEAGTNEKPEYETEKPESKDPYSRSSASISTAKSSFAKWVKSNAKCAKISEHFNGGFSGKLYPSEEAMKESGKGISDKDGNFKRNPQAWTLSFTVKPVIKDGKNSLYINFQTKDNKAIEPDDAKQLVSMMKDTGTTHLRIDDNMLDQHKKPMIEACGKKGVIPVLKPEAYHFYTAFLESVDGEAKGKGWDNEKIIQIKLKLLAQIEKNNTIIDSHGNKTVNYPKDIKKIVDKVKTEVKALEIKTIKEELAENQVLLPLSNVSTYTAGDVVTIKKAIEEEPTLTEENQYELKKLLLNQIENSPTTIIEGALEDKTNGLKKDIKTHELYDNTPLSLKKKLEDSFEKDDNTGEVDSREAYATMIAAAAVLKAIKNSVETGTELENSEEIFNNAKNKAKKRYNKKMYESGIEKDKVLDKDKKEEIRRLNDNAYADYKSAMDDLQEDGAKSKTLSKPNPASKHRHVVTRPNKTPVRRHQTPPTYERTTNAAEVRAKAEALKAIHRASITSANNTNTSTTTRNTPQIGRAQV